MMCYRDMTFCKERKCKKFNNCMRALTEKVKQEAVKWWGNENAPISRFLETPECFEGVDGK